MSIKIRKLDSGANGFHTALRAVLAFEAGEDEAIERSVAQILADVKARGDEAVLEYTNTFDRLEGDERRPRSNCRRPKLDAALEGLEPKRRAALEAAAARVRGYHEKQRIECGSHSWHYTRSRRHGARPEGHAARSRRHLRAGRQGGVSVVGADERDSGARRGRRAKS